MTTKDEALKLALEALKNITDYTLLDKARVAIREALAEQPAQQQEPPFLEPDYYVYNIDGQYRLADPQPTFRQGLKEGVAFAQKHTSPPASKPWVGLTDDQIINVAKSIDIEFKDEGLAEQVDDILTFARAIEAKLREKNA